MTDGKPNQPASGQKIVLEFLRDELQPVILKLQSVAQQTSSLRVGFWGSFTQKELRTLEQSYVETMSRFMVAYKKWYFPDEMFKDVGSSHNVQMLSDYIKVKPALKEHIQEGFRLLEYIDRILSGQKSTAYNRVAMSLSIVAITVSVMVAIWL
ncbi:MAG: hypothetical protein JXA50_06485 [Deltaproteobacteria bacterium]|nr:hypothetical protein [Deltaproteobacteria bacterium]